MKRPYLMTALGIFASTSILAACSSSNDNDHKPAPTSPPVATPTEACKGAPVEGRCLGKRSIESCSVSAEGGGAQYQKTDCSDEEECRVNGDGEANCELAVACRTGDTQCSKTGALLTCKDGAWIESPCSTTCVSTPLKSVCRPPSLTLTPKTGRATFQRRKEKSDFSALESNPITSPARGFLVTFQRGTDLISATTTSVDDGSFTLDVPAPLEAGDVVKLTAVAGNDAGTIAYMVADPGFQAGKQPTSALDKFVDGKQTPSVWAWEFAATSLNDPNAALEIPLEWDKKRHSGGAVANVFDQVGDSYRDMKRRFGKEGAPLAIWMGDSIEWDCAACEVDKKRLLFATRFQNDLIMSSTDNETYFSDSVIRHETGHYVMSTYGRAASEAGAHSLECESYPGLAWSEGFASWFAEFQLKSKIYSDIAKDSKLICDYEKYTVNDVPWPRPTPAGKDVMPSTAPGVLQRIAEAEVTATLLKLSKGSEDPGPILNALASLRMTKPVATADGKAYERGYFAHEWSESKEVCQAGVVAKKSAYPTLTMADLFDAMLCAGFDKARLDAATEPTTRYPFPSASPLCRPMRN